MEETVRPVRATGSRLHVLREVLSAPRRYLSAWYGAYLVLGLATAGVLPVLLPLLMVRIAHDLGTVAYVMGTYNLGLLASPLWGRLAEKHRLYRPLFVGGFALTALGLAVLPFGHGATQWLPEAFVLGAGAAAAATVASLLIIDFAPQAEWEPRIGWLQSFNGAGQVLGLALAALLSARSLDAGGLWMCAFLLLPAAALATRGLPLAVVVPRRARPQEHPVHHLDFRALAVFPRPGLGLGGLMRHSVHLHRAAWLALPALRASPFTRFLLSWFLFAGGIAPFFAYFPLMLRHSYGIAPGTTSIAYASAAAVGIPLFVLASQWSGRFGPRAVYFAGLALRSSGFVLLLVAIASAAHGFSLPALVGFVLIVLGWPLLSVSGTGLAARLTPFSEGAAMGLFNASGAIATVIGTFVAAPLVHSYGFEVIPWAALVPLGLALALSLTLPGRPVPNAAPE